MNSMNLSSSELGEIKEALNGATEINVEITASDKTPEGKPEENAPAEGPKPKARIHNLIIIDESGSMNPIREVTLSGVNETIETIRSAQREFSDTQVHTLTIVTFNSGCRNDNVRTHYYDTPIELVGEFDAYCPNGCTPLYDAMGDSITRLRDKIINDPDATGVVTVLSDGLENDSHIWNPQSLRKLITDLKEEGWTFSYMGSAHDVKSVIDLLSIDNAVEFSHDRRGASNTWSRESASRKSLFGKINKIYEERNPAESERERMIRIKLNKRQFSQNYYSPRVTPEFVKFLEPGEVFVFGSNAEGFHGGGAAAFAMNNFGAVWGQGEGFQGQSYAIPTVNGMQTFKNAVDRFINFAMIHPEMRFLVTKVGCGVGGHNVAEVARLFTDCIKLENVALPADFWDVLGLRNFDPTI